ncbi:hypothetical protein LTR85_011073 [Meristemomyces frigidus]|nr:hypothetical protein LTR85_011073 [Meristemomyces frigidus]
MPMRSNYLINPALQETPQMKKYGKEDGLLSQPLLNFSLIDITRNQMAEITFEDPSATTGAVDDVMNNYIRDALSCYMRELWTVGDVSMTNVFAARLWLDIIEVNAGKPDAAIVLKGECAQSQNAFQFKLDAEGVMGVGSGVRWLGKNTDLWASIDELHRRIDYSPLPQLKMSMLEGSAAESFDMDDPDIDPALKAELEQRYRKIIQIGHRLHSTMWRMQSA